MGFAKSCKNFEQDAIQSSYVYYNIIYTFILYIYIHVGGGGWDTSGGAIDSYPYTEDLFDNRFSVFIWNKYCSR